MSSTWPLLVFAFVVFFYLLSSLYDERKDRSVLFWKSLPVSDRDTVLSKVASVYSERVVGQQRLRVALLSSTRLEMGTALIDFAQGVRRYWVVTTVFGLIVALLVGAADGRRFRGLREHVLARLQRPQPEGEGEPDELGREGVALEGRETAAMFGGRRRDEAFMRCGRMGRLSHDVLRVNSRSGDRTPLPSLREAASGPVSIRDP